MKSTGKTYDLNLLTALDALLSTGSVTAAAERMHLSTPAMSHTLARIREAFDDPILVRAGRKLVPTPRALALVEPVREVLAKAQALTHGAMARGLDRVARRFVLRAPEGFAASDGAKLLQALERSMPLATLQFLSETHHDPGALREGRIDLDVGSFRHTDPETEWLVLSQQRMLGAVHPGHALAKPGKGGRTVARFAAARHVGVSLRIGEASAVDAALLEHGLQRHVVLWVPSVVTALVTASNSDLVACAPERAVRTMAVPLGLVAFELPVDARIEPMRMAWHPRHDADPAHRCLRECVQEVLDGSRAKPGRQAGPHLGKASAKVRLATPSKVDSVTRPATKAPL